MALAPHYEDLVNDEVADLAVEHSEENQAATAQFDEGYRTGWGDARAALELERDKNRAALRHRLEDMSFTYREAWQSLSGAMTPLLTHAVTALYPYQMQKALASQIAAEVAGLLDGASDGQLTIVVAPDDRIELETALTAQTLAPFSIADGSHLAPGQAEIIAASAERRIDVAALQSAITSACEALSKVQVMEAADV